MLVNIFLDNNYQENRIWFNLGGKMKRMIRWSSLVVIMSSIALGTPLWVRSYNGSANSDEDGCAVFTDGDRNVIVIGSSPGTGTAYDIVVIKYSPNGDSLWCKRIAGSGMSNDYTRAGAIDASGAVYLTATTGNFPNYNILTMKINPDGSEAWRDVYQGSAGGADDPADLVIDAGGNVFVTGYETDNGGVSDFVTIKYNSNGTRVWVANYNGGDTDKGIGIALAPDGGVYVTGPSLQGSYNDFAIIKYSAGGAEEWVQLVNGSGNAEDTPAAIGVDAAGNVYVTGQSATAPPPGGRYNCLTVKYSPSGSLLWSKVYTGVNQGAQPTGLVVGGSAVFVTGKVIRGANSDIATVAYNPSTGDTLWARFFNAPANRNDEPAFITLDPQSRVHIAGWVQDTLSRTDYCWLRYSPTGVLHGSCFYNGSLNNDDRAVGLAIDATGEVVITGVSYGGAGPFNYDILTVKYDSAAPGIAEIQSFPERGSRVQLLPNPTSGFVSVKLSGLGGTVRIWGVNGGLCLGKKIEPGLRECCLNLKGFIPGVYLLEVQEKGYRDVAKLVLE